MLPESDDGRAEAAEAVPASRRERIGSGRTAEVFATDPGEVVKVLRPGMAEVIGEREAMVAGLVDAAAVAAPRFLGVTRVDGRLGLRYERLTGISMLDQMSRRPLEIDRLATRFAELHAAMHAQDGTGLPDQRAGLRRMLDLAGDRLPAHHREAALARLEKLPAGTAICHGDMHPGNVMLGSRPVVIDWLTATRGDPAGDVARTLFLVRDSGLPGYLPRIQRALIAIARRRFASTYLRRYAALRPLDPSAVAAWRLPILAARLGERIDEELPMMLGLLDAEARA